MIHGINSSNVASYTLVMNTDNHALSEYTNFPFNGVVRVGDVFFASASDGIYILDEGNTDNSVNISSEIQTGLFDTMTAIPKMAIITGSVTGELEMSISIDNGDFYMYPVVSENLGAHVEARCKFGRGLNVNGRYAQCGIKNISGSAFVIDSMRVYSYPPRKRR